MTSTGSVTLRIPSNTPLGTYFVIVRADNLSPRAPNPTTAAPQRQRSRSRARIWSRPRSGRRRRREDLAAYRRHVPRGWTGPSGWRQFGLSIAASAYSRAIPKCYSNTGLPIAPPGGFSPWYDDLSVLAVGSKWIGPFGERRGVHRVAAGLPGPRDDQCIPYKARWKNEVLDSYLSILMTSGCMRQPIRPLSTPIDTVW